MKLIAFRTEERTHDAEDFKFILKTLEAQNITVDAGYIYSKFNRYFTVGQQIEIVEASK